MYFDKTQWWGKNYYYLVIFLKEVWPSKNVVRFSKENPILVTGDAVGDLDVYRLYGYDDYSRDVDE